MKQRIGISIRALRGLSIFGVFCFLTLTEFKVFQAWPQVTLLWNSGHPLLHFIDSFHFTRYLVAHPGLALEEVFPGIGFSTYISIFVTLNMLLFRRVHTGFTGYPPGLLVSIVFMLIHLFMNGRGVIGWLGWLLCLSLHCKFSNSDRSVSFFNVRNSGLVISSILLSSVSSGIFIVVFVSTVFLFARILRASTFSYKFKLMRLFSIIFASAIIGVCSYFAITFLLNALQKIILFYGSYTDVFMHGIGLLAIYFDLEDVLFALTILAIGLGILRILLIGRVTPIIWPLLIISMVGGTFGFTTLTLNIPLMFVFFSIMLRIIIKASHRITAHEGSWK